MRAARDARNIQRYSLERWGQDQATEYDIAIDLALEALRERPQLGRSRDELRSGLRSYPVKRHTIFYQIADDTLIVHRILHQRVDVAPEHLT